MSAILGTGSWLPDRVVGTGGPGEWIPRKTGIVERRWAEPRTRIADAAQQSGHEALRAAGVTPEQRSSVWLSPWL
ncbi:3-oxoacyl-[acyl-carrier-protein] synthase-3 [Actinopolyspora xinjiangensis]|uniref:3-oxoacyl-[acyl-carrier-protein] synthase-3 n=1 Tax=Actinopolyspora xinjiangensis TaxID=405564 RepID=A0A1H0PBV0_9ACTN|nr:hypothetical protein [Actinopolyspora xinjiangensis]SDP02572.1 3-oxoacyl-[acyl-carrier-protein] synthase-3 [Actinopolyspora xinjiangensis]